MPGGFRSPSPARGVCYCHSLVGFGYWVGVQEVTHILCPNSASSAAKAFNGIGLAYAVLHSAVDGHDTGTVVVCILYLKCRLDTQDRGSVLLVADGPPGGTHLLVF